MKFLPILTQNYQITKLRSLDDKISSSAKNYGPKNIRWKTPHVKFSSAPPELKSFYTNDSVSFDAWQ